MRFRGGLVNRHGPCDVDIAKGHNVPKHDDSAGLQVAMTDTDRAKQRAEDGGVADAKPACVALVPLTPSVQRSHTSGLQSSRPSPIFVTHLIATAAHAPQTRSLRRATPADAKTAYSANQHPLEGASVRTRQII
jgi:hypothetical protein